MALRNEDRTDREMLVACAKAGNGDGVFNSNDVAEQLGIPAKDGRSPGARVAGRLSWMTRLGQLQRLDPKDYGRKSNEAIWTITPLGQDLMKGRLAKTVENTIVKASPGSKLLIMRSISQAGMVNTTQDVSAAVRREFLHTAAQAKRRPR